MSEVPILDITNEEYHARSEWSASQVKLLPGDPMLFCGRHITKTMPFKPTAAMKLGTKVHRILLDGAETKNIPDDVLSKVGSINTNAYRAWEYKLFSGLPIKDRPVPVKEDDPIKLMIANLRAHKTVKQLRAASVFQEKSIIWTDRETGLELRARPDDVAYYDAKNFLWDLKTGNDIRPHKRRSQIAELGYHRSLEWYRTGLRAARDQLDFGGKIDKCLIVWVQSAEPYHVVVDQIAERALSRAHEANYRAKKDLAKRLKLQEAGDPEAWLPDNYHLIQPDMDLPDYEYEKEV